MPFSIGPYEIVDPLFARGGQSELVAAKRDGEDYVLKLLAPSGDQEAEARFNREAWMLAAVPHENIVKYIERGSHENYDYIAMPRLPGRNLRLELRDKRRLSPQRVIRISIQLCRALKVIHGVGIVFRDLKPDNAQIDPDANDHVWLLDFGYARFVDESSRLTRSGSATPGTTGYRAPEQLKGRTYPQSDLFALGVVMYELLSGVHPFERSDEHLRSNQLTPLRAHLGDVPRYLDELITNLLNAKPSDRPESADAVIERLQSPAAGIRVVRRHELPSSWRATGGPLVFRVTPQNRQAIEAAAAAGCQADAYIARAADSPSVGALQRFSETSGGYVAVDPCLHESAFGRSLDKRLDFEAPGAEPYEPSEVLASAAEIATLIVDSELDAGASLAISPAFSTVDLLSTGWLGANAILLDTFADRLDKDLPLASRIIVTSELTLRSKARQLLIESLGRRQPDTYLVSVDGLTAAPHAAELLGALEFGWDLSQTGVPVVFLGSGALGPILSSCGFGVEYELHSEPAFAARPSQQWRAPRFWFESLLASLRIDDARAMLERGATAEAGCRCPACGSCSTVDERLARHAEHNAHEALRELMVGRTRRDRQEALEVMEARLASARRIECNMKIGEWQLRVQRLEQVTAALTTAATRRIQQVA